MNMKIILITVLCLFTLESYSQEIYMHEIDSITNSLARQLIDKSSNQKVLIYQEGCIGCYVIDGCSCYSGSVESYIIWQPDSTFKIMKFDCCKNEAENIIGLNDDFWAKLNSNKVFNSEFKSEYIETHHDFYKIKFIDKQVEKRIKIYGYYFDEDNKYKRYNEEQPGYKYLIKLKQIIKEL